MPLLSFHAVDFSVGGPRLLEQVDLAIEPNERVCIVGRNGAGKSTLLRLMSGEASPDDGEVRRHGSRVASLPQDVPADVRGPVYDVVAEGLGELGAQLARYHHITHDGDAIDMDELGRLQTAIDAGQGWQLEQRVEEVISRLDLPGEAMFESLSGGMKRRVLLGRALAAAPDLLLLDEPTNHLDIESIAWLEEFLKSFAGSVVFVTHDRAFLRGLATRIVEIDRGQVTSWPGDYDNYLRRREERLHAEAQANALFDRKLAQEEVWIRQGIKARRTRNEGRVTALKAMRRERAQRRELSGNVQLAAAQAAKSGRRVFEAKGVDFAYGDRALVRDFSTIIQRGDKVGLIGPNGAGKTTVLKLLLGDLQPQAGEVRQGTNLEIAFFDQLRGALREDWSALDNVSEGREFIEINGSRKHALGYLQDFLFSPERARAPITKLSGGERNRLLLAKLFARPSNVLVMEGHGRVGEYVGGYSDWLRQRPAAATSTPAAKLTPQVAPTPAPASTSAPAAATRRKLGFKEQRELEQLPALIETLEAQVAEATARIASPELYREGSERVLAANQELSGLQARLDAAYARWNELD